MPARTRVRSVPKITQPRRLPGEVPWTPSFQYVCAVNDRHLLLSEHDVCGPCPVCIDGEPCGGELVRFGAGSRGPRS